MTDIRMELLTCPEHGFSAIAIGANIEGSIRVTRGKCCGRWDVTKTWTVSAEDVVRVCEDAIEDVEAREAAP